MSIPDSYRLRPAEELPDRKAELEQQVVYAKAHLEGLQAELEIVTGLLTEQIGSQATSSQVMLEVPASLPVLLSTVAA